MTVLCLLFQYGSLLFLFLHWLWWLGFPKLGGIKVVRVHPCFILDLRGDVSSFSSISTIAVGLSYMAFIILRFMLTLCSLYAHFLESFYYKWTLNFIKSFFFCIYWDDHNDFYVSKFQNTKLNHGNPFHFYMLTMKDQKGKLREKISFTITSKKKKNKPRNNST